MGKRKLILGITIGAVVGGATALFDRETRDFAKGKLASVKSGSAYFISHPSEAIHSLRDSVEQINQTITNGTANAINALEQVESTLDKVTNKTAVKEIE